MSSSDERVDAVERAIRYYPRPLVDARELTDAVHDETDAFDELADPRREVLDCLRVLRRTGEVVSHSPGANAVTWAHSERLISRPPPRDPADHPGQSALEEHEPGAKFDPDSASADADAGEHDRGRAPASADPPASGGTGAPADNALARGDAPADAHADAHADDNAGANVDALVRDFRAYLRERPPKKQHAKEAVVDALRLLRDHGTMSTGDLRSALYQHARKPGTVAHANSVKESRRSFR